MKTFKAILVRLLLAAVVALAIFYAGDYAYLRLRIARANQAAVLGSVEVHRYDAVTLKNGKVQYYAEDPVTQTCVRSLFPHLGYTPCWYLNRHTIQYIPIMIWPFTSAAALSFPSPGSRSEIPR
jgi:hypothetical protein